ncbi:bifunctional aspartate kinase/homoserine dehydrogenase I [Pasteurellaceae bacterium HPA106]|uniref:bifunctional aspartate kinase/homoserine dehydrogenase I n=1 Tax=Spirabiliibacterium pneumoniae TaxID=221400 RepID=UPI001AACD293|nr:bifunctional aspartate kinase/homoserine dehydrogenase I [Spirabiliibacterium pneumoniae]MBE2895523.1 bifunctional aspartate kinase/homoserine dehydrogenase I [Spirabiliibacterium pneumoniae]
MRVLKFGGTSLANPERFLQAAGLIEKAHLADQAAGVLSAPAKITNFLVALVEKACQGQNFEDDFQSAKHIFHVIINGLHDANPKLDKTALFNTIDTEFQQLHSVLDNIAQQRACPDSINATILCRGEKLSIAMMRAWFEAKGYQVTQINPAEKLVAQGSYLESSVSISQSKALVDAPSIPKDHIVLMAGFTARNEAGELVLLGRNGSDYSAAVLAACLDADFCEIWTDVDGVFTCDPRLVPDARLLDSLSYQEAMELAYFGAKVIHPRTIGPLVRTSIPCVIKNTGNPQAPGTYINNDVKSDFLQVKGITNLDNVSMFNISGPGMQGMVGMAARVFSTMSKAGISVILITQSSSEYSISFCVPSKLESQAKTALETEFAEELSNKKLEPLDIISDLSIISVVGDGMKKAKGIAARFFTALAKANINIVAIAQGSSERSISVVVPLAKSVQAVRATHRALFSQYRELDVFIVGTGGVGGELVDQIERQQAYLEQKNIAMNVYALANSQKLLLSSKPLNLTNWREQLEQAQERLSLTHLMQFIKENHLVNPVFVDCTSNQEIANAYADLLASGFHVVTPNKKANTADMAYYQQLRDVAARNHRQFMYDTNVGAGLPVIDNLQKLIAAGDEIQRFDGILSGSLSFIFGKLEEGMTLSQATQLAKEKGYTEPDPRDDLSGSDVARKLLILARECGLNMELDDIEVQGVLPEGFAAEESVEGFLQKLPQLDEAFAEKVRSAQEKGQVLRYVGRLEDGKCKVSIVAVDGDDPLYKVKNGENALAFYSRYYNPIPLLLRGYGAGNDVTAAGIFADILRTVQNGGAN